MTSSNSFALPDLKKISPLVGSENPHFARASEESFQWALSFNIFVDRKMAYLKLSGSNLLCSHVYHYTGYDQLRTCMDFVNLLFTIDEISDEQNGTDAWKTGTTFINALSDANFDDGTPLCKMSQEFRGRLADAVNTSWYQRFIKHCRDYMTAVAREAELREQGIVLDLKSYEPLRRENSAVRCCFGLFGHTLGLDLPDEIFYHPLLYSMHLDAVDMVCWSNDLYSYNMEQAMGHTTNNVLSVLMQEYNVDLQAASYLVGDHYKLLMDRFLDNKKKLPSFGPKMDKVVDRFVMAMEAWVAGNLNWSFETPRYFGRDRQRVKDTLVVNLYPRRC
ncbi:terpenoid synthase [Abortiporus biennis]|nr:terpenoid synthase [Abortiporus biennis]